MDMDWTGTGPIHVHLRVVIVGRAAAVSQALPAADGSTSIQPSSEGSSTRTPVEGFRNPQINAAARERTGRPGWFGIIV